MRLNSLNNSNIPAYILAIFMMCVVHSCSIKENGMNNQVENHSIKTFISEEDMIDVPYPVANWLKHSGVLGKSPIKTVNLKQKAKMKMKPEQEKWYAAQASQTFDLTEPSFIWKVKMKISPFVVIRGKDQFKDGKGQMKIKLCSLFNLVNEKGPKIDEGTMQRFMGEMVWFPTAALDPCISWEMIDSCNAKAYMNYGGTTGSGTFHFNKTGDFIGFSAMRYYSNTDESEKKLWQIEVLEHAVVNGIKIPVKMQASWHLESGKWTWLQLEIFDIEYNL